MTDTNKLKELAERALLCAPGEWFVENGIDQVRDGESDFVCETGEDEPIKATYIAAANPKAILGLIAEVERLNDELSACTEHPGGCGYWREAAKHRAEERDQIQAEIERFKDANREISETNIRRRDENVRLKAENEALRKQLEQVHPFKFAGSAEGPDLKCAACGGYHYGLPSNMPCPKNAAIAQDAALEGGGNG